MCWCMRYLASNSTKDIRSSNRVYSISYLQNQRSMLRLGADLITRDIPCDSDVGSFVFLSRTLVRCNVITIVVEHDSY